MALRLTGKQNYAFSGNLDKVRTALGIDIYNNIGSDDGVANISYFKLGLKSSPINPGSATYNNPYLIFQRETQSPANNDAIRHLFRAQNDAHEDIPIALWNYSMPVVTDGAETGRIQLRMKLAAYAATRALLEAEGDYFRMLDDKMLSLGDNNEVTLRYDEAGINTALMSMTTATTNDVVDILALEMQTSGTPAQYLGVGISARIEDLGGVQEQASVDFQLYDPTDAAEKCNITFRQNVIGTIRETLNLISDAGATSADYLRYTSHTNETNGIVEVMRVALDCLGTPANNLGAELSFHIEDAGGAEQQAAFQFQLTDVTDGAEDCDIILRQNIAGAMTTRLTLDADGAIVFVGPVSVSVDDASNAAVTDILTLTHTTSGVPAAGIGTGLVFNVEDAGGSEEQGSIDVVLTTVTDAAEMADISVKANVAGTITEKLLLNADGLSKLVGSLEVENGATFGTTALVLDNDDVDQIAMDVEASNTIADIINVQAAALTTAKAVDISNLDAITTGKALHIDATGVTHTSGVLVHVDSGSNVITGAGRLFLSDHTNTAGVSAVLNEFITAAADETVLLQVLASGLLAAGKIVNVSGAAMTTGTGISMADLNALTTGIGLHIASSAGALFTGVGRLLYVNHTGAESNSGILTEIASNASDETVITRITASGALANGVILDLSGAILSTGTALDIGDINALASGLGINVASTSVALTSGELLQVGRTASGTIAAKTGDLVSIFDTTTHTLDAAVTLNYDALEIVRTHTRNTGGVDANTSTLQGTVLRLENASTQTTGTVTDSVDVLGITQDADSTGQSLDIDHNANSIAINIDAENTTTDIINLSAAVLTTGIGVDIPDLDLLTTGKGLNIASGSEAIAAGELATFALTSSGSTITAKTGALVSVASSRTELAAAATADNYDVLSVTRTNITNTLGTLTADGSVARLENVATQTAGTLTDNVDVLEIVQGALSTGQSITIDHNPNSIAIFIDAENVTTNLLDISAQVLTTGKVVDISDLDAITTGKVFHIDATGITQTDGILVHIDSASTALTATGRLLLVDHTGAATAAAGAIAEVKSAAADDTTIFQVLASAALAAGEVVNLSAVALTTGKVIDISDLNAITTGKALHIDATGITQTDGILVHVDSASTALTATGRLLLVDHTGASTAAAGAIAEIKSAAADDTTIFLLNATAALAGGIVADISAAALTTGKVIDISNLDAFTTGKVLHIDATGITQTDGMLIHLDSASTALTATGRLFLSDHTGAATVSGVLNEFKSAAADETIIAQFLASAALATGKVINISAAAMTTGEAIDISDLAALTTGKALHIDATGITQTDGILVHIDSASTAITATGRLLLVDHTGASTAAAGAIAEIKSAATEDTTIFLLNATAALAGGIVQDISAVALTTGKVIDISDLNAFTTGKVVHIDATGVTQTDGMLVHLDSASTALTATGRLFLSDHTGAATVSGVLNEFKSAAADETIIAQFLASAALAAGKVINISAVALTTGEVIDISDLAAITTGNVIHVDATGVTQTDGRLIYLDSASTALTATGRLFLSDHTGTATVSGVLNEFKSAATDETVIAQILASAALAAGKVLNISAVAMTTGDGISMANLDVLTTGRGLHIASAATAITGAGRLAYINHTGVTSTSGTLVEVASAATDETDVVKITGTGQGTGRSLVVTGGVNMNPIGGYNAQEGMNNRYRLEWTAGQRGKPGLNADIQNAAEATRMIADPDFEILGTNAVSTSSAFNAEGGITFTTAAVAADQVILAPHLDANQSAWAQVTWGTDQQTRWECRIRTGASIVDAIIWAGLKLTNTAVVATDNDQVFFRYEEGVNVGEWQAVSSIGGVDTETDTNIAVAINTDYHLVIEIASDRTAKFYIDGVLVSTTAALTNAVDLIPYIGIEVQALGAAGAKAVSVRGQAISRNFA